MKLVCLWGLVAIARPVIAEVVAPTHTVASLCGEIESLYRRQKWQRPDCAKIPFESIGVSSQGRPLLVFRSEGPKPTPPTPSKLTVVQCGIHGDELPTLPMCMSLIREITSGQRKLHGGQRLAVQPLLNPDGMLASKPTRQNGRGVDINRNFPTRNWAKEALKSWKAKDKQDPRKFPGDKPNSEPEAQAIVRFIEEAKPQKIISIHTPLGFLDLDTQARNKDQERRARYLAINIVKNSGNYTFRTFGVYPGSLGNFSGREHQIPVYTLELPSGSSPSTIQSYWTKFRPGLWRAIDFDLDTGQFAED